MKHRCLLLIALVWLAILPPSFCAAGTGLDVKVGPTGPTSIRFGGTEFLSNGTLQVAKAVLADDAGHAVNATTILIGSAYDAGRQAVTQTYAWGSVVCTYTVSGNRLNATIDVRNTSPMILAGIQIQLLEVNFPQPPSGWKPNYGYLGPNLGDPTVEIADFGTGTMAVCNEDIDLPLLVGFPGRADLIKRPIVVCTSNIGYLSPYLDPYLDRPIRPGKSDKYRISLRFGPSGQGAADIGADLYAKLAKTFPSRLKWDDHRPIGTLHLAVSEALYHSPSNPRGWFADPSVDVTTEPGRAAFKMRVLKYADDSVAELKTMKAQGMITWDLEGEEYPQSTTYIGDPRLLPSLAPEMEAIADAYFLKFRDAGLRTGLCIRPQKLVRTDAGASQTELPSSAEVTQLLFDKMEYANHRWGCTLFYIDSNGDPNVPYDPAIFERLVDRLHRARIQALVIPEHRNTRYYDSTAPYTELRLGYIGTTARVRAAYPKAFMANYLPDGPMTDHEDALIAAAKSGDILMFRGWWADPQNAEVLKIWDAAAR